MGVAASLQTPGKEAPPDAGAPRSCEDSELQPEGSTHTLLADWVMGTHAVQAQEPRFCSPCSKTTPVTTASKNPLLYLMFSYKRNSIPGTKPTEARHRPEATQDPEAWPHLLRLGHRPGQADHFRQPAWARAADQEERCYSCRSAILIAGPAGLPREVWCVHGLACCSELPAQGDPPLGLGLSPVGPGRGGEGGEGLGVWFSADTRHRLLGKE